MTDTKSIFSAAESGLGFIYQPRLALLKILALPESASLLIEKSDDLEFDVSTGRKSLASLKHKAVGDRLIWMLIPGNLSESGRLTTLIMAGLVR